MENRDLHFCIDHKTCANHAIRLHQGEVVEGEVMPPLSEGPIVVKIKGSCIPLQSRANLIPGDRVILTVTKLEPKLTFRLLYKKGLSHNGFEVRA